MKTFSLYQDLDISSYTYEQWEFEPHQHHFFELIYIEKGTGIHHLNENAYAYTAGDLFLLVPRDYHSFEITATTQFTCITFHQIYFTQGEQAAYFQEVWQSLEQLFAQAHLFQYQQLRNSTTQQLIAVLIPQLEQELSNKAPFHKNVLKNGLLLLLQLLARHIYQQGTPEGTSHSEEIGQIYQYIHQHIHHKEALKISQIAQHFLRSKNYISNYFKQHTGQTIRQYIQTYRLNLVKSRLCYSSKTIREIAFELGFSDESHLNKQFKAIMGCTAKQFRQQQL